MAITYTDNGGGAANGSDLEFTFTFPVLQTEDVKVALNAIVQATTKYAVDTASNPTKITFNNTSVDSNVQESTGAPKSGVAVRVFRQTTVGKSSGDDDPKAVYAAGSSIRATDLNANTEQALYAIHELQDQPITDQDIEDGAITSAKIQDGAILNVDVNGSAAIAGTKISPDFGSQNIATTGTINSVTTTELAILDGATVSTAELNLLDGVTSTTAELNILDGVTATATELNIIDGVTATTAEINKLDGVTASTAELNLLDGVTATTTELNLIDGVTATTAELNYVDGVTSNIQTQLNNKQPLDAELTELATMANGTASALADLNTGEVQILDGATVSTTELNKLDGVTASTSELNILDGVTATATELNLNDGQTATPTELNILDGATVTTTEINKLDGFTGSAADLNEVVTGKNVVETITGSATDAQLPTAQAVNERVVELVTEVGGFVPIANETSFPATNPDINDGAGTIVSIKALSSNLVSNGSGVATIANGAGTGNTVTINGMSNSTTYAAGKGLILETTSTLHTYNFHRLVLDETGVASIQVAIDDWDERYYGPLNSAPSTRPSGASRVQGDLYFNTADNQMKVFNSAAGQWDDVATSASSNIVTLTPAFNNSETEFTCSTVPIDAQSLLLSINGVVQKPNSGTSTPSEGFVKLANGKIKLATAPASGADYFAIALGNVVSVGTPSPNTVGATELKTGEIANTHVSSSAAIAGSKLADDSISLAKLEHGTSSNNGKFLRANNGADPTFESVITDLVNDTSPQLGGDLDANGHNIKIGDGEELRIGDGNDLIIKHDSANTYISNQTGELVFNGDTIRLRKGDGLEDHLKCFANGAVELYHDNSKKIDTTSYGARTTGNHFVTGSFRGDDNAKLDLGSSNDLQIFHDGSNSRIKDTGTGSLKLSGNEVAIENSGTTETMATFTENGAVELFFDNSKKIETTSGGVTVTGTMSTAGVSLSSGAGAVTVNANSDIRLASGNWTGNTAGKIQHHDNILFIQGGTHNDYSIIFRDEGGSNRAWFDGSGHFLPGSNNAYDLGSTSNRWRNIYTNDLHLSNEGHSNEVDGTWGNWTIQEGESDLFLKNNRSGKKYKFNLTEVS